ncbi:MAG TPA: succinyl-diaminopimelate desuccinylase [Polyangiaceae bacterium]|nr:succinyl-diaminopimelate desuccinylase [Polyangiaceae bacterium]
MSSLADRLLWLCSIPSPTGEEHALSEAIAERLAQERPGAKVRKHGRSLVVPLGSEAGAIVLAGHLDTVRSEPMAPVRREGDRIYGCGASDMKAGLALMMHLSATGRELPVTLVFYAGEEGPYAGNELERVLRDDDGVKAASFAVCLEPSDNELQLGCCGTLHARVTFSGTSAHSARPWQGDNAIHKAGPLLLELSSCEPRWVEHDGLRYATVTSATMASGGSGRNVVPGLFEVNVNHRFGPGTSIAQARAEVESLVGGRAAVEFVDEAPSALPHRGHEAVRALESSGVRGVSAKQAWTDVARFEEHGIAGANFGPGIAAQAHQRGEWASVKELEVGWEILNRWLRVGCAG